MTAWLVPAIAWVIVSPLSPPILGADLTESLARAAHSPYEIERFVAVHDQFDWAPLWKALDLHDLSLPPCTAGTDSAPTCSTDLISVFDPAQVILVLRHASNAAEIYLRFIPSVQPDRSVHWRLAGSYQPAAAYFRPRYHIKNFGQKPFLILSGHAVGAADASTAFEEWFDLTQPDFESVFHFTPSGRQENSSGVRREVRASVVAIKVAPIETIEVSRLVAFSAEDLDGSVALGQSTTKTIYVREGPGRFWLDQDRSASEDQVARLYEDIGHAFSNEEFLRDDLIQLKTIAQGGEGREKRWLRSFLPRCKDTEEKRALQQLIDKR